MRAFIEDNLDIVGANVEPFDAIATRFWAKKAAEAEKDHGAG